MRGSVAYSRFDKQAYNTSATTTRVTADKQPRQQVTSALHAARLLATVPNIHQMHASHVGATRTCSCQ